MYVVYLGQFETFLFVTQLGVYIELLMIDLDILIAMTFIETGQAMNRQQPVSTGQKQLMSYAYVKTLACCVKIHIRHYRQPTKTKGGRLVPSQRGIVLDLKEFLRLVKVQKHLATDYNQHMSSLCVQFLQEKLSAQHPEQRRDFTPQIPEEDVETDQAAAGPTGSTKIWLQGQLSEVDTKKDPGRM